jgi:hypothetical protein
MLILRLASGFWCCIRPARQQTTKALRDELSHCKSAHRAEFEQKLGCVQSPLLV